MHPHSTQSRNYMLTYSCTCVSTHFSTHVHPHSHMITHSCTHVGFCTHSGAHTYAQHTDTQEYAPADTHMLCAQAASHSLTQQATQRGACLPSFHPERKGHGIGSPDSRDATNQATWKGRHRLLQSAGESWTILLALNTPLMLHGTHKPSRREKYL